MRHKIYQMAFLFCLSTITSIGQTISAEKALSKIWLLENEKFEGYQTYLYIEKTILYKYECINFKLSKSDNYYFSNYYFLSDLTFNTFPENISNSELATFFNDSKNKKYLHDDCILDFSKEIIIANVVHATIENESIADAHLYQYQFYDKDTFSQYGFGWTPGQPQIGYLYRLATNVPREVMIEIQNVNKIKFKTLTQKQGVIFSVPNKKTNMYLLKGDIVEVLEEKNQWLKIRYYGGKTIEGWIKKTDVE